MTLRTSLLLALICCSAAVGTKSYLSWTNTLANHENWIVRKLRYCDTLTSTYFVSHRNTLAHDELNLGKWHGFNQLDYLPPLQNLAKAEFKIFLSEESHVEIFFRESSGAGFGIRISANQRFPSQMFLIAPDNSITPQEPLPTGWLWNQTVELALEQTAPGRIAISLNGKRITESNRSFAVRTSVGFYSAYAPVTLKRFNAYATDGRQIVFEDFSNHRHQWLAFAVCLLVLLTLNRVLFGRNSSSGNALLFHASILVCLTAIAWVDYDFLSTRYPKGLVVSPQSIYRPCVNASSQLDGKLFDESVAKSPLRVLLFGTSQTFGLGTESELDSWGEVLNGLIRRDFRVRTSIINAAKSGSTLDQMLPIYEREWFPKFRPQVLIADLGSNDRLREDFKKNLESLVEFDEKNGVRTVLITEPNSSDHSGRFYLLKNHELTRQVARQHGVKLVDMGYYFETPEVRNSGLLWSDYVHLSTLGQKRFAEELYRQIKPDLKSELKTPRP